MPDSTQKTFTQILADVIATQDLTKEQFDAIQALNLPVLVENITELNTQTTQNAQIATDAKDKILALQIEAISGADANATYDAQTGILTLTLPKGDTGAKGDTGDTGITGATGKSAYELAKDAGFVGSEADWLLSLKGDTGDVGATGANGIDGNDGKSAYELAKDAGFVGSEADWLLSLKGDTGAQGIQGEQGIKGDKGDRGDGLVINGSDTAANILAKVPLQKEFWLATDDGHGYYYDLVSWTDTGLIRGEKGDTGATGPAGPQGIQGAAGVDGVSISSIAKTATNGLVDTYTIELSDSTTITFDVTNGATPDTSTLLAKAGGTMSGAITSLRETKAALTTSAIDLATANFFTKTITAATTFTLSNVPTAGQAFSFILELTNAGSATITWFAGVKWAGGTAPTLTASGVDILGFYTHDAGTTWRGLVLAKDSK